jgi:seryl-tRNA synthetase
MFLCRTQRAAEECEIQRLEEETTALIAEVGKLNMEQAKLHNDIQLAKQQGSDLSDQMVQNLDIDRKKLERRSQYFFLYRPIPNLC